MAKRRKIMMLWLYLTQAVKDFIARVKADGGTVVSPACIDKKGLDGDVVMIPSGGKAGTLYSQIGTDGIDDFDVARNSTKWVVNKNGLLEEVLANVPAFDYSDGSCPSLLTEPQSTNLYLNSELNNVENTTVTATPYTVFLYGTGTITFSGAYVGTLVGTGVNDKVEITFTPSAGTLTSTDSGSVDKKQLENLGYSTSYIPTSGATATRLADVVDNAGDVNSFNSEEGVLYVEMAALSDDGTSRRISISDGSDNNRVEIENDEISGLYRFWISGGGSTVALSEMTNAIEVNFNKIAIYYNGLNSKVYFNGFVTGATTTNTPNITNLSQIQFEGANQTRDFYGNVKALKVFKTALTDTQLTELTTDGYITTP